MHLHTIPTPADSTSPERDYPTTLPTTFVTRHIQGPFVSARTRMWGEHCQGPRILIWIRVQRTRKTPYFFRVFVIDEYRHLPYADRHLLFLIVCSTSVSHAPMSEFESNRFERVHPVRKAVTVSADYRIHRPYL